MTASTIRNPLRSVGARTFAFLALLLGGGFPSTAAALPLLSEVFYDAVGRDDGQSFVELYAAPGTDLAGIFIEGINGSGGAATATIALSGVVPDDGFFVLADVKSDGTTQVPGADLTGSFDFQNGPDSIVLRTDFGVFDAVGYGVFGAGDVFAGEGGAAPDPPAGSSLARRFANVDSDDNLADFVVLEVPTPGTAPLLTVPEPSTALLVCGGLVTLGGLRRRPAGRRAQRP